MIFILFFLVFFFILFSVAFLTLLERHFLGFSQNRLSINKNSFLGILQAFFDGLKLLNKNLNISFSLDFLFFFSVPFFLFILMLFNWLLLDKKFLILSLNKSFFILLVVFGVSVYFVFLMGYYSVSKFPILSSLRSSLQSISFELVFFFLVISHMVFFFVFFLKNFFFIFFSFFFVFFYFLFFLVEVGRAPFDFLEAESELVSGYNLEFMGVFFVLIFLSEYGFLIFFSGFLFSFLMSFVFFMFFMFFFLFLRCIYPRLRIDVFFDFFWFFVMPIMIFFVFFVFFYSF